VGFEALPDPRVIRGYFPPGRAGTFATLQAMRSLALQGAKHPLVRGTALQILQRSSVPERDLLGELRALFRFVQDGVRFTRDVRNVETLQTADYTLRMRAGDCDDKAVLLAALLLAVGHPADLRYKVIATDPARPAEFTHVYVVADVGNGPIPLDATAHQPAGWEYGGALAAGELRI